MSSRIAFIALSLAAVFVVSGSCVAASAVGDSEETLRLAVAEHGQAAVAANDARAEAIAARVALFDAMAIAGRRVADAQRLVDSAGSLDVSELSKLIAAVEAALPNFLATPVPAIETQAQADPAVLDAASESLDQWSSNTILATAVLERRQAELDAIIENLADGVRDVARTVSAASATAIGAAPLASEEQRDAVRRASETVMADLRTGADPIDSLLGWSQSVASLAQAQVAAVSPASGRGGESPASGVGGLPGYVPGVGAIPPGSYDPFVSPRYFFSGARVGSCPTGVVATEYFDIYSGVDFYFDSSDTYSTVTNEEFEYVLILYCE